MIQISTSKATLTRICNIIYHKGHSGRIRANLVIRTEAVKMIDAEIRLAMVLNVFFRCYKDVPLKWFKFVDESSSQTVMVCRESAVRLIRRSYSHLNTHCLFYIELCVYKRLIYTTWDAEIFK